jgi:hypothetical protein
MDAGSIPAGSTDTGYTRSMSALCAWCGAPVLHKPITADGSVFCSLSHSVKDQHAKKLLGPKVKHNPHGTRARYLRGCRCQQCLATPSGPCRCPFCLSSNAQYQREHRAKSRQAKALAEIVAIEKLTRPNESGC